MPDTVTPISAVLAFGLPGHGEWIILLVLGLLIFGRRLPEVGRSLGRGIVEFKRGIKGLEDDIEDESNRSTAPPDRIAQAPAERLEPCDEAPEKVASAAASSERSES